MCLTLKWLLCCGCCGEEEDSDSKQPVAKKYADKDRVWEDMQSSAVMSIKVDDTDWPQEYKVPDNKYKYVDEVIAERGYDPKTQTPIGSGAQSKVYTIVRTADSVSVVLKSVLFADKESHQRVKRKMDLLKTEIALMSHLKHKNIVPLLDKFIINIRCYLVMDWANGGDLQEVVNSTINGLSELRAKEYFVQIARAVAHLHHQKRAIAHRDIKLQNVLIYKQSDQIVAKLGDFGLSRVLSGAANAGTDRDHKALGTQPYFSPQLLKLDIYYRCDDDDLIRSLPGKVKTVNPVKADMWALGVCLYYMYSKRFPYVSALDDYEKMAKAVRKQFQKNYKPLKKGSPELMSIVDDMLNPSTKRRLKIDEVLGHRWLSGVPPVMKPDDQL